MYKPNENVLEKKEIKKNECEIPTKSTNKKLTSLT